MCEFLGVFLPTFASSGRAAENTERCKEIVANSSVVPNDLPRLWDRIE